MNEVDYMKSMTIAHRRNKVGNLLLGWFSCLLDDLLHDLRLLNKESTDNSVTTKDWNDVSDFKCQNWLCKAKR